MTSSGIPGLANGGRLAVTNTAATFFTCTVVLHHARRNLDSHALQNAGQRLNGEVSLLLVSRTSKAHHQSITDERIVADPLHAGHVAGSATLWSELGCALRPGLCSAVWA